MSTERRELRDVISGKLVPFVRYPDEAADAVMELFPYVRRSEWMDSGFVIADVRAAARRKEDTDD